jgi:GT2 family glycosyltransferase
MNSAPLVAVIVLNYNGVEYLNACLSSLKAQTYKNYQTIVFDNASTDKSTEFIKQNFPNVTLIEAEENFGFAKGNNLAIQFALKRKADYVLLINNDTESEKNMLEKLISTAENDGSIGVVGPAVFDLKNKRVLQEMGMAIDRFGYPLALKTPTDRSKVFFVSGCAMLIKSELLRRIGLFDEKYFMFAEDLDLCWRAQLEGYEIGVNENARVYHASGASILGGVLKETNYKTSAKRVFLREKNTLRTLIKNYGTAHLFMIVPFYINLLFFESAFWMLILKPQTATNVLKAIFWNVKFIPNTLRLRSTIQNARKINDAVLTSKMVPGYSKLTIYRVVGVPKFAKH